MSGSGLSFFVGVGAGIAILAVPVLTFLPGADVPGRVGAWIAGPPPQAASVPDAVAATRPQRGFVPGDPTPSPDAPPPTLQALSRPTAPPPPAADPTVVAPPQASGARTGVIRSGVGGVAVQRVAGVASPNDPRLADGSPVLISTGQELDVRGERWRAVRGLNGVAGWVLSSHVSVDGEQLTAAAAAVTAATVAPNGEQARVANTGGVGVALRGSPNDADRLPSGLRDGTPVEIVERLGADWARIRAASGQEGWVPARYLAPQS